MIANDKISQLKSIAKEIQIGVILIDILLTLYVLWLIITDTSSRVVGELFGFTPFGTYLLLRANKVFGLCWLHKLMLLHSSAVYICCIYQAEIGFANVLSEFRWVMFSWGVLLILWLCIKRC